MKKGSGCLFSIIELFKPKKNEENKFPYKNKMVLSPTELSFYFVLKNIVKEKLVICPQVSFAEFIQPEKNDNYRKYLNKIIQKRVDFLLCHPKTMKPIIAIELDDKSHNQKQRKERDIFVNQLFKTINLPLLRIRAKRNYDPREISQGIKRELAKST